MVASAKRKMGPLVTCGRVCWAGVPKEGILLLMVDKGIKMGAGLASRKDA